MNGARLHVLMTTDAVGGAFNHTLELARALTASDVAVSIVILGPAATLSQREQLRQLDLASLHELELRLEWMENPWEDLERAEQRLLELERDLRPDVIHAGSYFCGRTGFAAPVVVVAHSCVYSWWHAVHDCEPPPEWHPYRRLVISGLAGADAVVAPTRAMLAELRRHYTGLPARSMVIANAVALDHRSARKESFVLAAGRMWDPAKNLEALRAVADALPRPVLIAGELAEPLAVDGLDASGARNARLLGQLSAGELARLRRRAPVFAAPARYEPFGLSILEAAGSRCALVLGDIASLRETWDEHAVFVAPEDHEALRFELESLLIRPERASQMGREARLRAEQLSPASMVRAYGALYRELARERVAVPG